MLQVQNQTSEHQLFPEVESSLGVNSHLCHMFLQVKLAC